MDSNGKLIFSTSPTETSMSSKKMKVSEIGGIQFSSSIETQSKVKRTSMKERKTG